MASFSPTNYQRRAAGLASDIPGLNVGLSIRKLTGLISGLVLAGASWAASLREYETIPAATPAERTPSNGWPGLESYGTWTRSLGGPTSNRYSTLKQINRETVSRLKVAWTYNSGDGKGNVQANPVIVGGTVYLPTAGRAVVALDGVTGREKWRYAPPASGNGVEASPARRGLVFWPGDAAASARLFFTAGEWLYALNPDTGLPIAGFGDGGRVPMPGGSVVAGAVYRGVLVQPGFKRDVFGFDVVTGRLRWRFNTIPEPEEFGGDTWVGSGRTGANCWGGMALDESRGIAYVSTGSPKANYLGATHTGDNLFANCIVALNAESGERVWHFQEIRHDIWDLDVPAPPNLVTIELDGRRVDAVAQVTKIGNTLLLDRVTGKPLFPFRLRRAPASLLEGEQAAAYQPDPELPQPFARQVFSREDVTTRTPEAREAVLLQLSRAKMGWFEPFDAARPLAYYGMHGGAEWTGAAFDPTTGRLYVSSNDLPWLVTIFRDDDPPPLVPATTGEQQYQALCAACHGPERKGLGMAPPLRGLRHHLTEEQLLALVQKGSGAMPPMAMAATAEYAPLRDFLLARDRPALAPVAGEPPRYSFGGYRKLLDPEGYPGVKPPWGSLNCIDLNTGRLLWKVPLGEYPELTKAGLPKTGTENFGGATVTAGGLVFCSGTRDRKIRAFDAESGAELWSADLPLHGTAAPAVYEIDGRQYVIIAATGGGKLGGPAGDAWVAFALP